MNKNSFIAILLIGFGVYLLMNMMGIGTGWLEDFVFPIGLVVLGYFGLKNGRTFIGWLLILIGAIHLMGSLSGLFGWILAVGLIVLGYSLLKRKTV